MIWPDHEDDPTEVFGPSPHDPDDYDEDARITVPCPPPDAETKGDPCGIENGFVVDDWEDIF